MLTERTYTAGLYLRLSKDDDDRDGDSSSIKTPKTLLVSCFFCILKSNSSLWSQLKVRKYYSVYIWYYDPCL